MYQVPSIKKAFEIISLISRAKEPMGVSQIAKELGYSKGTVFGILKTLEDLGVLVQDQGNKTYGLGITLVELGRSAYNRMEIRAISRPFMERLMEQTGGTVFLGVLNNRHVTILEVVESNRAMKITSPKGVSIPLFAAAVGKVMLSFFDQRTCEGLLKEGLPRYTHKTITDTEAFLKEVSKAKELGYAKDEEEYMPGVWAVAAPIRNWKKVPASIWVVGFLNDLAHGSLEEIISATKAAARDIEERLASNRSR